MPQGRPKSDIERAMTHYGISEAEYLANPGAYPLPARGFGQGITIGDLTIPWGWILIGVIVLLVLRK